ncbi:hypothetical protein BD830_101433 [Maritimibacter alkaliphilus HTCC2654]|uniref:Excalibur calcium-binding domain-containing protein n=1 Tax=Maritimibacter alkaliphilus HTCC2654 TaxID=314271 RepID=A3VHP8_9RHOB|nr:hypothetical protein [Maritimibacter alkaliphilus]EAQ12239.1 hypothetical protein RB2654_08537 [Rhodobacterales bacterium HTCC2654] [Maritimibacter alkaliphilus HTCC2654]TYP85472.1 hypothetical protein BD830_101433 [Maritimibacter alkaliphilus HTCC2654]
MRNAALLTSVLALAACAGPIPDSGAQSANEATLPGAATVSSQPIDSEGAAIAAETSQVLGLSGPATTTTTTGAPLSAMSSSATVNAGTATVPPVTSGAAVEDGAVANTAVISDENNFQAVSERESIQSDAERLAENRAQYVVIHPTEVPQREGGNGASVVKFALATNNARGQQLYSRSGFNAQARFERNCAKYSHSDLAQEAFLNAGGPNRDPQGLDPDGDGFACYWDPAPFRAARQGAPEVVTEYTDRETLGDTPQ